jgi:hypothetical protein
MTYDSLASYRIESLEDNSVYVTAHSEGEHHKPGKIVLYHRCKDRKEANALISEMLGGLRALFGDACIIEITG